MPAGFGRAGARFVQEIRAVEIQAENAGDTETGTSILHII